MKQDTLWAVTGIALVVVALELTPRLGAALLLLVVAGLLVRSRQLGLI